jgi:hypothetical protein
MTKAGKGVKIPIGQLTMPKSQKKRASCGHPVWKDDRCAIMICPNYGNV